jgi:hypothetical protein
MINAIIDIDAIDTNIWMITFVDSEREDILFCFNFVFARRFQFGIIEEPRRTLWLFFNRVNSISGKMTYHVTFGAGNASHVICNVPLCPSRTLVSVND